MTDSTRHRIAATVARGRAALYGILCGALALLTWIVTMRIAPGGEWLDTAIAAALAVALWYQTARWYRRFRRARF